MIQPNASCIIDMGVLPKSENLSFSQISVLPHHHNLILYSSSDGVFYWHLAIYKDSCVYFYGGQALIQYTWETR